MEFEHQLKALIFYHLEEYSSGNHLIQAFEKDDFTKKEIAIIVLKRVVFSRPLTTEG